jgi:hypothetical protein
VGKIKVNCRLRGGNNNKNRSEMAESGDYYKGESKISINCRLTGGNNKTKQI